MASGSLRQRWTVTLPGLSAIHRLTLRARRPAHVRISQTDQAQSAGGAHRRGRLLSLRLRFTANRELCRDSGIRVASAATPLHAPRHFRRRPPGLAMPRRGYAPVIAGGTSADNRLLLVSGHSVLGVSLLWPAPRAVRVLEASDPAGSGKGCAETGWNMHSCFRAECHHIGSCGGELVAHGTTAPVV